MDSMATDFLKNTKSVTIVYETRESSWPACLTPESAWEAFPLVTQVVKSLPAMRETWVQSLGQEDPLEKEIATHSSILVWKIPWIEEPGRLQSMGLQRVAHN